MQCSFRWTWSLLGLMHALVCLAPMRARAEEAQRAAARELGTVGMEAYFDQDYAQAADKLDRAYRLYPTPTLGLWSARALIQLGQWVRAAERLRETQFASAAIGDNDAQRQAQADAADELSALQPRIPRLIVVVDGPEPEQVTIEIDGAPFDRSLIGIAHPSDPGTHRIVGTFREQRVELEISLAPGASELARLRIKQPSEAANVAPQAVALETVRPSTPAPPPSNGLRIAAITALSLGGAALATSLISTLLASERLDSCEKRAGSYYCQDTDADAYEALHTLATVSFYGGAALAATGLTLWLLQSSADSQQTVSIAAKPLAAQLTVKF